MPFTAPVVSPIAQTSRGTLIVLAQRDERIDRGGVFGAGRRVNHDDPANLRSSRNGGGDCRKPHRRIGTDIDDAFDRRRLPGRRAL